MKMLLNKIAIIFTVLILLFAIGCEEKKIEEGNLVQIENVGIRTGVFERKFKMTNDFNETKVFTPEFLKNSIEKYMLTDHLLICDAYKKGFNEDPKITKIMLEYRLSLIASNNPIYSENISIAKDEMAIYYNKKKNIFNFEVIQHNSYYWADSISRYILDGNELKLSKTEKNQQLSYPRQLEFKNSSYGDDVPVEIYDILLKMKEGEVSEPIHSGPVWIVLKLNAKKKNGQLPKYEEMLPKIVDELQPVFKDKQLTELTKELKIKYNLQINKESIGKIIKAFEFSDGAGSFSSKRIDKSDLDEIVISTTEQNFNVDYLLFILNRSNVFRTINTLTPEDINSVIEGISDMIVLYFDGLEKGVDKIDIIQDQLENKENRLLYSKYLKDEIAGKIVVTKADAEEYYNDNRDKWPGDFINVKSSVINKLRQKLAYQRRDELAEEFRSDFNIQYNMELLKELADKFTEEKKSVTKE